MQPNGPLTPDTVRHADASVARPAYISVGFTLCRTNGAALRRRNRAEDLALDAQIEAVPGKNVDNRPYTDLLLERKRGLISDPDLGQLRIDLNEANQIALDVPSNVAGAYAPHGAGGPTWAGLQKVAMACPAITSADSETVTFIFSGPPAGAPIAEVRRFRLDTALSGFETIVPAFPRGASGSTVVPLPHALAGGMPSFESWANLPGGTPPRWPVELDALLLGSVEPTDQDLGAWIDLHYAHDPKGQTHRADVWRALLAANTWLPSQLDEKRVSTATEHSAEFKKGGRKRGKDGYRWQLSPRAGVTLAPVAGVSVASIDPLAYSEFLAWRASREIHPQVVAERKAAAAAAQREAERAATVARHGGVVLFDSLQFQEQGVGNFHTVFEIGERHRREIAKQNGRAFHAIDRARLQSEDWLSSGKPGCRHHDRYLALVERVVAPLEQADDAAIAARIAELSEAS